MFSPKWQKEDVLKTSTYLAAKRISWRTSRGSLQKKAQIAAKKISNKYKKISYKKAALPPPVDTDDTGTVTYTVAPKMGAIITANKIKNKYKKMMAKNRPLPFDLHEIEQGDTIDYVDDTNVADINLNRNAAIAAKKISEKYKNIRWKRNRVTALEPVEQIRGSKRQKGDRKLVMMAAKKMRNKDKKLRFR